MDFKKIIEFIKQRPPLTGTELEEIQKQCEKDEREIRERMKINWEDLNRPMDF